MGTETLFAWITDPGVLEHTSWKVPEKMFTKQHHPPKEARELCGGERQNVMGIGWE